MKSLGSHFKKKREEEGYDIEDVARETNIASRYIRAIEEQDFSQFPADVYAKGFIRSYAQFLDLDAESLVMEYSLNFEGEQDYEETEDSSRKLLYWLGIGVIAVVVAFLLLLRFAWLPAGQQRGSAPKPQPNVEKTVTSSEKTTKESVSLQEEPGSLQLRVVATGKTWVYAIFDGMRKREFMFQPGDEMTWNAEDTIRIRVGNAGGLRFYHDGTQLPNLGNTGEVADRVITLSDGTIHIKSPR
jgi:transcriptional regulator with XRE-family HTH domain